MKRYVEPSALTIEVKEALAVYPELLQGMLARRGIVSAVAAESFLAPDYEKHLHDPFLLKDMDRAVERILLGMRNDEKILVYTDYDCDGGPAGVLLASLFRKIGYKNFSNYIPHRHNEGYGINLPAVEKFAGEGVTLMITADCGITDIEPVKRAQELGIDVIVTDHHIQGEVLPPAFAVINHKRHDDTYPEKVLCGSGIAFKLSCAILSRGNFDVPQGWEKWLLDMAGLATIADMVPLTGENRAIAHFGLKVLRKSPRPGLQKLCRKMKTDQRYLTEDDIGFMIAPRINAASRMDEPMQAFRLLFTDDEVEADMLASHLNKMNDARKGLVASMAKDIKKRLLALGEPRELIVMGDPRWKPALLGLAANSLVEEYHRPVFLWGREGHTEGVLKGSCRSEGSVDVVELMKHTGELFLGSGGHAQAGGFSLMQTALHELEDRLIASYRALRRPMEKRVEHTVDGELSLDHVTWDTYRMLEKLAPFGEGNPKPLFAFPSVVISEIKLFGKEKNHLELAFEKPGGGVVRALGFFMTPLQFEKELKVGTSVDLIGTFEKSYFGGGVSLRLRIIDLF